MVFDGVERVNAHRRIVCRYSAAVSLLALLAAVPAIAATIDFAPLALPDEGDTFVASGMRIAARKEIFAQVAATAYDTPDSWDAELRVRRSRIGPWHVAIVRGTSLLCGATGNCQTWVFRLDGKHWTNVVAAGQAPIVSGLSLTKAGRGRPWRLATAAHVSATDSRFVEYSFDGHLFQRRRCLVGPVNSAGLPKGELREGDCS